MHILETILEYLLVLLIEYWILTAFKNWCLEIFKKLIFKIKSSLHIHKIFFFFKGVFEIYSYGKIGDLVINLKIHIMILKGMMSCQS